jgi:hydroxymethylglutaryl-CoA reductase (NADPH)
MMLDYYHVSSLGGILTGSIGVQGHFANGLAAVFLATGQDVACVAEAAVGTTQMDVTADGDLYITVQLPNLIVGTVGGGTKLPTQKSALQMMDCYGEGKARKFAEIVAAVVLAGEISLTGAICAGDFDTAHEKYGR